MKYNSAKKIKGTGSQSCSLEKKDETRAEQALPVKAVPSSLPLPPQREEEDNTHPFIRYCAEKSPEIFAFASLALTTLACIMYRHISDKLYTHPQYMVPAFILTFTTAVAMAFPIRYEEDIPAYRILCRAIATIMGVYAFIYYPAFPIVETGIYAKVAPLYSIGRWVAIACAAAAWIRPSFVMVPCIYVILMKDALRLVSTIIIGRTDYIPLPEMGLFLCFGLFAIFAVRLGMRLLKIGNVNREESTHNALLLIFLCAIAVHFANYFMSGWAKIILDGGPLSWVLENRTNYLIISGHFLGTLPFGAWPSISALPYKLMQHIGVLLNAVTIIAQLLTIFAITRVRSIIAFTLFFDLMHISIFLLTGVNFWLWIILNFSIVGSCVTIRDLEIPKSIRYIPIAFIVLSVKFLHIAELGWYDSRAVTDFHFVAVTDTGKEYRVPSNYFYGVSYAFYYLSDVIGTPDSGHFHNGPWGSNWSIKTMHAGNDCKLAVSDGPVDEQALNKVGNFIRAQHAYIMSHLDSDGRINYDFYPHHHFTNPWYYQDFKALDKRTIVAYKYVLESACLDYNDQEGYKKTVMHKTEHLFNVR